MFEEELNPNSKDRDLLARIRRMEKESRGIIPQRTDVPSNMQETFSRTGMKANLRHENYLENLGIITKNKNNICPTSNCTSSNEFEQQDSNQGKFIDAENEDTEKIIYNSHEISIPQQEITTTTATTTRTLQKIDMILKQQPKSHRQSQFFTSIDGSMQLYARTLKKSSFRKIFSTHSQEELPGLKIYHNKGDQHQSDWRQIGLNSKDEKPQTLEGTTVVAQTDRQVQKKQQYFSDSASINKSQSAASLLFFKPQSITTLTSAGVKESSINSSNFMNLQNKSNIKNHNKSQEAMNKSAQNRAKLNPSNSVHFTSNYSKNNKNPFISPYDLSNPFHSSNFNSQKSQQGLSQQQQFSKTAVSMKRYNINQLKDQQLSPMPHYFQEHLKNKDDEPKSNNFQNDLAKITATTARSINNNQDSHRKIKTNRNQINQ